jgi:hypothetical protein
MFCGRIVDIHSVSFQESGLSSLIDRLCRPDQNLDQGLYAEVSNTKNRTVDDCPAFFYVKMNPIKSITILKKKRERRKRVLIIIL